MLRDHISLSQHPARVVGLQTHVRVQDSILSSPPPGLASSSLEVMANCSVLRLTMSVITWPLGEMWFQRDPALVAFGHSPIFTPVWWCTRRCSLEKALIKISACGKVLDPRHHVTAAQTLITAPAAWACGMNKYFHFHFAGGHFLIWFKRQHPLRNFEHPFLHQIWDNVCIF